MNEFKIDLQTGDRFWTPEGLGALGMDPNRAIAELVANSLDWRKEDDKIIINITIGNDFIEINDNGVGMTEKDLQNAIKVSVANEETRKSLRIRKGMFGMGMKVACLTLGWKITFRTRSIDETNLEHILELDTRKLIDKNNKGYRKNIKGTTIDIDHLPPLLNLKSGTSIRIEDLTYKNLIGSTIKDSIQEVFKPELRIEDIEINIIDEKRDESYKCERIEMPILSESKIILDDLNLKVNFKDSNVKSQIKGWIALLSVSRPSGDWGLHLYKNNQIIERFHQLPSRIGGLMPKNPHAEFSRTYGEIELDMCAPAFHKVGFDHSSIEWKQVQDLLAPHLNKIMEASRDYKKSDSENKGEVIKKLQKHQKASKKAAEKLKDYIEDQDKPEEAITLSDGRWFTIVPPIFKELHEEKAPWLYNYAKPSNELSIMINTKSPIYQNVLSKGLDDNLLSTLVNWSISECLFFLLVEVFEYKNPEALTFRNNQLSKLFAS